MPYELEFLVEMNMIHLVFHVSILRKFIGNPSSTVPLENVSIEENLAYEEVPIGILKRQVKSLRNKEVVFVKLL